MRSYPLEPDRDAMQAMGRAALDLVADFVDGLPQAPTFAFEDADDLVGALLRPPPDGPGEIQDLLAEVRAAASQAIDTAGGGYLAFIPGGGLVTSALAELVARALNRYTGLASFAPALVAMEEGVLRWLCHTFGLAGERAGGLVTTGGSLATLDVAVAARHRHLGDDDGISAGTAYVTEHTHRCVAKALGIAGLPAGGLRVVPTTADLRMDPSEAERMVTADRAAGRRPFLLVATAGTTSTGTVDPLPELARVARDHGLWFHVDAAYGGFFQLTERGRRRLAGIEQADSLVLDPHKGLFLPYGTGVVLVRDTAWLHAAFAADGVYLQDAATGAAHLPDYADRGPELTRDFRGLRLWLPLHLHGVAAFREALDEKLDLAAHAHQELSAEPALELPWVPDLSTVVFRRRGDDAGNRDLLQRINGTRRVFLSSTQIGGRHTLRLCVLSHRTHHEHVAAAVAAIRDAAKAPRGASP